jgi:hypothetical protein
MEKIHIARFVNRSPGWRIHGFFRRVGQKKGASRRDPLFLTDLLIGIRFLAGCSIPMGLQPEATGSMTFCNWEQIDNECVLRHNGGVSIRRHWGYFVWGLVSAGIFGWSAWSFHDAEHHQGPGVIFYEETIGTPVGAKEYKKRMKSAGTALALFGIVSTICLLSSVRVEWKDAKAASVR